MANNKGIGKGLAALFSEMEKEATVTTSYDDNGELNKGVTEIALDKIICNPTQPRKHFDEESLNELATSISSYGVLQPIILCEQNGKYIIVAGERRYRACEIAGLKTIPAIVRELNGRARREVALIENLQRSDLNVLEEAEALRQLMSEYKLTQDELSHSLGKSRSAIANTVRLTTLSAPVQALLRAGSLSAGHARCLIPVTDEVTQLRLAQASILNNLSVRELENMVANLNGNTSLSNKPSRVKLSTYQRAFVYDLQKALGTKVRWQGTESKGKICIEFHNEEEIQRIMTILRSIG